MSRRFDADLMASLNMDDQEHHGNRHPSAELYLLSLSLSAEGAAEGGAN